jgi:hypothetical protein
LSGVIKKIADLSAIFFYCLGEKSMNDKSEKNPVLPQGLEAAVRKITQKQRLRDAIGDVPKLDGCNDDPNTCERKRLAVTPRCKQCWRL